MTVLNGKNTCPVCRANLYLSIKKTVDNKEVGAKGEKTETSKEESKTNEVKEAALESEIDGTGPIKRDIKES